MLFLRQNKSKLGIEQRNLRDDKMIKLVICEDQLILLDGIASAVSKYDDIQVVGKITEASKIIAELTKTGANTLLTDVCTEDGNSLNYLSEIRHDFPDLKIVVMTGLPEISFAERAKQAGADSFVYKNVSTDELANVIRSTFGGYNVFPAKSRADILSELTKQELTVLRYFCQGLDRKEIAEKMFLSESSIKTHISNMLAKTGYNSISRLAIYVVSSGLIVPNQED